MKKKDDLESTWTSLDSEFPFEMPSRVPFLFRASHAFRGVRGQEPRIEIYLADVTIRRGKTDGYEGSRGRKTWPPSRALSVVPPRKLFGPLSSLSYPIPFRTIPILPRVAERENGRGKNGEMRRKKENGLGGATRPTLMDGAKVSAFAGNV